VEVIVTETVSEEEGLGGADEGELDCVGDGEVVVGLGTVEGVEGEVAEGVIVGVNVGVGETVGEGEAEAAVFSGEEY
jgi:hypothetical protein